MHVAIAENRMVDLHQLHVEVIREGGHTSVSNVECEVTTSLF